VSRALVDHLKLEMEPHPCPYTIDWIKKGLSIKVTDLCYVHVSIGKFYQDYVACDVVDMDTCYILLGRPWQHDVDATHSGKRNIYTFTWKGKRVAMRPISPIPKFTKEGSQFIFICNRGEFLVESKKTKKRFALVVKQEVTLPANIPEMRPLLEEFKGVVHDELSKRLPSMRDI